MHTLVAAYVFAESEHRMSSTLLFVFVLKRILRSMRVDLFGQLFEGPALHNEALMTFVNR